MYDIIIQVSSRTLLTQQEYEQGQAEALPALPPLCQPFCVSTSQASKARHSLLLEAQALPCL